MTPSDAHSPKKAPIACTEWPPLKKALWDVIMSAEVNGQKYIVARDLTEKLFEAILSAAEPVAWYWEDATGCFHITLDRADVVEMAKTVGCTPKPLFAGHGETSRFFDQPAPSVAVKALQAIANYRHHSRLDSDENAEAMEQIARSALSAQVQDVAEPALKLGIYGKAYDRPEERRAYTYDDQPDNIGAHKLGRACSEIHSGGDWIDRGLNLLNALKREGFGVFELPAAPAAKQEGASDA